MPTNDHSGSSIPTSEATKPLGVSGDILIEGLRYAAHQSGWDIHIPVPVYLSRNGETVVIDAGVPCATEADFRALLDRIEHAIGSNLPVSVAVPKPTD